MICQFSTLFQEEPKTFVNLLELADRHGNTPLFTAIKVNSVNCLKILVSYKVNFFHRKKNGNTCLHECAQNNAIDCLIVLTSYCGHELFSFVNREGNRAIDIAFRKNYSEVLLCLQKLERNIMYQDALLERDQSQARKAKPKIPGLSQRVRGQEGSPHTLKRYKQHKVESEESEDSSLERRRHLPERNLEPRSNEWNYFEQKKFIKHSKAKRKKETPSDAPSFKNYRAEMIERQHEEKSYSRQPPERSSEYYPQMNRLRAHQ